MSGAKGLFPFAARRKKELAASQSGKRNAGKTEASGDAESAEKSGMARNASAKPRKAEPVSPIKIFAGAEL